MRKINVLEGRFGSRTAKGPVWMQWRYKGKGKRSSISEHWGSQERLHKGGNSNQRSFPSGTQPLNEDRLHPFQSHHWIAFTCAPRADGGSFPRCSISGWGRDSAVPGCSLSLLGKCACSINPKSLKIFLQITLKSKAKNMCSHFVWVTTLCVSDYTQSAGKEINTENLQILSLFFCSMWMEDLQWGKRNVVW